MSPQGEQWDERLFPKPTGYRPDLSPGAFNWWYADADFDNGYMMAISYHFGLMRPPGDAEQRLIEFSLHDPEGNAHLFRPRFSKEECTASEEMCHVVMRHNFYRWENASYHVYFSEGELGCDLTYEPIVPGYQADLSALPGVSETYGWYMISPKSRVKGTVTVGGKTLDLSGYKSTKGTGASCGSRAACLSARATRLYSSLPREAPMLLILPPRIPALSGLSL